MSKKFEKNMKRINYLYKVFLEWFKRGFNERKYFLEHPNRWLDVDKCYAIEYEYHATFRESLPWNNKWTYIGYYAGYYAVEPFCYSNFLPEEKVIKDLFYKILSQEEQ